VLSHYTGAPADVQKALAAALAAAEKATPAPAPKAAGKAAAAKDPGGYGGAKASETSTLRDDMLAFLGEHKGLSLAEARTDYGVLIDMPDEAFEMAEQIAGPGAGINDRMKAFIRVGTQVVKMAEGGGDGELVHMLRTAMPRREQAATAGSARPAGSQSEPEPMTFAESRPDVQLAKLANEIRLSEDVDYGQALSLAKQRDPALAKRYVDDNLGGPAPKLSTDRPDVELAERARARAETDGIDYGKAMSLELAENPALAARYLGGAGSEPSVKVKVPAGMRLVSERPDVQLAERVKVRQERDGVDWVEASRLELAEDAALASRYADWKAGRTALQEASYRAEQIRTAPRSNLSPDKAFSAALAEDPQLRAGVGAYFEKAN
jgi:hypothetical protein